MKTYNFKKLLQNTGWLTNATVSVDKKGIITVGSSEVGYKKIDNLNGPFFQC